MCTSMVIELLTHVHRQCAVCNEPKSLEYVAMLNDGDVCSICRQCRDVILREESLKQVDSFPLWITEEEIRRLDMVPVEG